MKAKATLLVAILGIMSLTSCNGPIMGSDVKDWDTPAEMLAFADYYNTPTMVSSYYGSEATVGLQGDKDRTFQHKLEWHDYQKAKAKEEPDCEWFSYTVRSPYFEYVTVNSATLKIFTDGYVKLTVFSTTGTYNYHFSMDKDAANQICNDAKAYFEDGLRTKSKCDKVGQEQANIESFVAQLKDESTTSWQFITKTTRYNCQRDEGFVNLISGIKYTSVERDSKANKLSIYLPEKQLEFGTSQLRFHLRFVSNSVEIECCIKDDKEREFFYRSDYSIALEMGEQIYNEAYKLTI